MSGDAAMTGAAASNNAASAADTGAAADGADLNSELPPLHVGDRIEQVRQALGGQADAMVVTDLTSVRWCSGFTGSNAALFVSAEAAVLLTDGRYAEQAPAELSAAGSEAEVEVIRDLAAKAAELAEACGAETLALEPESLTWAMQRRFAENYEGELVPTEGLVAGLRSVKTAPELARMQRAARIADDALAACAGLIREGVSERQLALALDDEMRSRGASGPAYETIVAGGPNSALPHARPGPRPFAEGDLVVIDVGAVVEGYRSDMTRTFTVGEPSERAREIIGIVTEAQALGVKAAASGVEARAVDTACREHIESCGYGEAFMHSTGHGVGLDIHELPHVSHKAEAVLRDGNVITVEPGIYIAGFGGCRVEDMVTITESGCRSLSRFPKLAA